MTNTEHCLAPTVSTLTKAYELYSQLVVSLCMEMGVKVSAPVITPNTDRVCRVNVNLMLTVSQKEPVGRPSKWMKSPKLERDA